MSTLSHRLLLLHGLFLPLLSVAFAARDSQGTEFILGYMENKQWKSDPLNDVELFITTVSNTPATVTVTTPLFNPSWSKVITVSRGNIEMVQVPHTIRHVGTQKSNKGVHIVATQEVSVYSVNKEPKSTDAYISLPVDVLGTEYYGMTFWRDAELLVVATEDNTQVTIKWPSQSGTMNVVYSGTTYGNGATLNLNLNKYETFHALQEDTGADFTGAYITSNKPISVVSGNKKVAVPYAAGSADHLTEMLMPVDTWGKDFLTTSTPDRTIGDIFRVVASEDNTVITLHGGQSYTISKAGYYKELDINTGDYKTLTSDKPVMVAMFGKTWKNDGPNYGDPAMSLLIPTPQYAADYTWSSVKDPTGADFNNKISVIIEKSEKSGLRLDGNTVSWREDKDIAGSTKTHLWTRVTAGSHNIYHIDPAVTFMALASGTYEVNSYAYAAGLRLAQINTVCVPTTTVAGDIVDNDCDGIIDEETLNNIDDDGDGLVDEDLATPPRIDGNWGSWGSWGTCSVSCGGTGTKTLTRLCNNPAPANNGLDCVGTGTQTASCTTGSCPVHGSWSSYGSWGSCSVTCNSGTRARTRTCTNPAPAHGGNQCAGSSSESTTCSGPSCAVHGNWANWASWGSCSVTCASGTKGRSRTCTNPAPANGGNQCSGSSSDSATCTLSACPVDGNWANWASWGSCSVTCASGTKGRSRTCTNPAPAHGGSQCSGSSSDSASCTMVSCPVDGNWANWASWGSCSVTCASGTKGRSRTCTNPAPAHGGSQCSGSSSDSATCTMVPCPVDGNWANWASWGSCSVTCASGTKGRSRTCTSPAPAHGGSQCSGSSSDSATCTMIDCSTCSGGVQADIVFVLDASGSVGSSNFEVMKQFVRDLVDAFEIGSSDIRVGVQKYSSGTNTEFNLDDYYDKNAMKTRIMNVVFTSGSTNTGTALEYMRTTMFTSGNGDRANAPNIGVILTDGRSNSYADTATQAANARAAGIAIFAIGIGSGIPVGELNEMSTDPDSDFVFSVSGFTALTGIKTAFQAKACIPPSAVNGNWGSWVSWSSCTKTCETGSKSRTRSCDSPPPLYGGSNCGGSGADTTVCNTHNCPVDGGWSSWQSWGACSVTCKGVGTETRIRNCDNPAPLYGGAQCPGSGSENQACDRSLTLCSPGNGWAVLVYSTTPGTPVNGGFGSWGQWSACSKSCGAGTRLRKRACNNPVPQFGGTTCTGLYTEKEICNNVACSATANYVQTCPERYFDCKNGNTTCIHYLNKCDCHPDCDDGSDEDPEYAGCIADNSICSNNANSFTPAFFLAALLVITATLVPAVRWSALDPHTALQ